MQQDPLSEANALLYSVAAGRLLELGHWDAAVMEAAVRTFENQIEAFSPSLIGFAPGELDKVLGVGVARGNDVQPNSAMPRKLTVASWRQPG